jgi:hypothetical protein
MTTIRLLLLSLAMTGYLTPSVDAHPLSMSDVVVDVSSHGVTVQLTILAEDLVLYGEVSTDGDNQYPAASLRSAATNHWRFLHEGFTLLDSDGVRLPLERGMLDLSGIPEGGIAQADLKQHAAIYHFRCPLDRPIRFTTVSQRFGGEKAILPTLMDCLVKQSGVVIDTSQPLTAGQTHTVSFDWENPPTPLKNWRELRERRTQQLQERLGIASYSGFYSFLYIEEREVRHEILVPLLTLEQWLPIRRNDPDYVEVDEQVAAEKQIAEFFTRRNPFNVKGRRVTPLLSRLTFLGLDIRDFALNAEPRRVSVAQARVGVILSYQLSEPPDSFSMNWDTFHEYAPFLRTIVYEFDEAPMEHFFRPQESEYQWQRSRSVKNDRSTRRVVVPVKRVMSQSPVTEQQAHEITQRLVANVYHSFEQPGDESVYDSLATSVSGPLLRRLYLQVLKSLLVAEQGNARSRLRSVESVSSKLINSKSSGDTSLFQIDYCWRVSGSVEHWGHIHTRQTEYVARLSVTAAGNEWLITDATFLDQKRISFDTKLRAFSSGL